MRMVVLSGGSGKRLWPLSNESRSKQFLKLLPDQEGNRVSMIQRIWKQLTLSGLSNHSVIATSLSQRDMVERQLGADIPLIIEPERRDTFAAVALAAVYMRSVERCGLEEIIGVIPVDSYVETAFFEKIQELEPLLLTTKADLALLGVKPTYPSEKYGYIVPAIHKNTNHIKVDCFKEKPNEETAKALIEKNALWNCGVFAFKLGFLINLLEEKGLPTQYNDLVERYQEIEKKSFDYEVTENLNSIVALSYEGYWKDLGTWNTLTDEMAGKIIGKGTIGECVQNSHIVNELDIPIILLGINDAVIAASPEGILVTNKKSSTKIKEYLEEANRRPMYEERRWGWYRVLEHIKYPEGNEVLTKHLGVDAGKNLSYQIHYKRSEVWTVVKGEGVLVHNDQLSHVRAGDVIHIPLAAKHALQATTAMEIIEIQTGSELVEEDIVRLELDWNKIVEAIKAAAVN